MSDEIPPGWGFISDRYERELRNEVRALLAADSAPEDVPPPPADPATNRPILGIKDAAKACGVHEDTIRRAYKRGLFPNSTKGAGGAVLIPITDLLAAGYKLHAPQVMQEAGRATVEAITEAATAQGREIITENRLRDSEAKVTALEAQVRKLEADVADLKAEKAQLLDLMGLQLKALNAGTPTERPQSRPFWRRGR